jgi:enterochelin esterase-like enzyme
MLYCAALAPAAEPLHFEVTVGSGLLDAPYTGRVYIMLTAQTDREPRLSRGWVDPPPVFAEDTKDWTGKTALRVGSQSLGHPMSLENLPQGMYAVQAVMRLNPDHPNPGRGPGDLISKPAVHDLDPATTGSVPVVVTEVVAAPQERSSPRIKVVHMVSQALSKFHQREFTMNAAVALPRDWETNTDKHYPVLYVVTGFGGQPARTASQMAWVAERSGFSDQALIVVPDANCYRGHSVFADSANNGPWGSALVNELIPHIESKFRGVGKAEGRIVTGVSSGGWSALWLQVAYPDTFNGCYAHTPDPVDFRDFQRIDLYAKGENMYHDPSGQRRPIMRRGKRVMLWYDEFAGMENVLGPGGQLHSFEAVFSPKGADGQPLSLWDRKTGAIDARVAEAWKRFDLRLILETNWPSLAPKLIGKIHVFGGGQDAFYLEGSVALLAKSLAALGSDAEVVVIPSAGHGPVFDRMKPMFEHLIHGSRQGVAPPADQ